MSFSETYWQHSDKHLDQKSSGVFYISLCDAEALDSAVCFIGCNNYNLYLQIVFSSTL